MRYCIETESDLIIKEHIEKLRDYIRSAKQMDEINFCKEFDNDDFLYHTNVPFEGGFDIYRSRLEKDMGANEDITKPSTFSYVPFEMRTRSFPKLHRCNYSGQSIFYASLSPKTNFKEINLDAKEGETVYFAKWHIENDAKANLFRVIPPEGVDVIDEDNVTLRINTRQDLPADYIEYLRILGSIMMNTEGSDKECYLPCALISNFVYRINEILSFDGIIYPSVKYSDKVNLNIALKPEFVDKHMSLLYVIKGIVNKDLSTISFNEIGFCHKQNITWYKPMVYIDTIKITGYRFWDKNGCICDTNKGKIFDKNHKEINDPLVCFYANFDSWMGQFLTKAKDNIWKIDTITDESSLVKHVKDVCVGRMLEGWVLQSENNTVELVSVDFTFDFNSELEKLTSGETDECKKWDNT